MLSTSLVFRIPQNGGVSRGAVQRNTILFPLKAYSLWNLRKAAASVRWRCTRHQCWLNYKKHIAKKRPQLNRAGWRFHHDNEKPHVASRITSCSFWLSLTLPAYSPNLAPCDFLFPSLKTKLQGIRFETSEAVLKKCEAILKDLTSCVRGMTATL